MKPGSAPISLRSATARPNSRGKEGPAEGGCTTGKGMISQRPLASLKLSFRRVERRSPRACWRISRACFRACWPRACR